MFVKWKVKILKNKNSDYNEIILIKITNRHNTEKVIYFLLLERKLKNPCQEDADEVVSRSRTGKLHSK